MMVKFHCNLIHPQWFNWRHEHPGSKTEDLYVYLFSMASVVCALCGIEREWFLEGRWGTYQTQCRCFDNTSALWQCPPVPPLLHRCLNPCWKEW